MNPISDLLVVEWAPASTPFATSPTWVNLTSLTREVSIGRGRSGVFDLYGTGTCTVEVNNTAAGIDPTEWHRWRRVRVRRTDGTELFTGHVQEIDHDQGQAPFDAVARIHCEDLSAVFSRFEIDLDSVPAEVAGDRIERVLDAMGIPAAWQNIDAGHVFVAAPEDGELRGNGWEHALDVAESEAGALFICADGVVCFEDRHALLGRLSGSPAGTVAFGDDVPMSRGEMTLTPPGTDYRNKVAFTGVSGNTRTVSDVPAGFPPDSLSRTLPILSDNDVHANAVLLLEVHSQTGVTWPRRIKVLVHPQSTSGVPTAIAGLDLRDYAEVKFTPAGGSETTFRVFTESIAHSITPRGWHVDVGFSSADKWADAWVDKNRFAIVDDADFGKVDTARVGP